MTLITPNAVISAAAKAELDANLLIAKLAGVVINDVDLAGYGKGMTKTYSSFELADLSLQVLNRGDSINVHELGQTSFDVTIDHLAYGNTFYDIDLQNNVAGQGLATEGSRQIGLAFADGLDNFAIQALVEKAKKVDATTDFSVQSVLDEATVQFGENVFNGSIEALIVHPTKAAALRQDPDFEKVTSYGYAQAKYGAFELGRLYGQIPVVLSDKVTANETGKRENILIPKNSLLTLTAKALNVENERIAKKRATELTADQMVGMAAIKAGIVFEA
ncbi:hypothetical protein ABEX78_32285 [Priestia megaterium]